MADVEVKTITDVDNFNFQAPQFIESLSDIKIDDGADTFFDALDENDTAPRNDATKSELKKESKNDKAEVSKIDLASGNEFSTKTITKPQVECEDKLTKSKETKEGEILKNGPLTRLQRMSMVRGTLKDQRYLSVAEQIHKFHHSTPPRFKQKPALSKSKSVKVLPTIAHSPQLRTKARARPSTAPGINFNDKPPVIKPIKRAPTKSVLVKPTPKPPTIPVPFNLTMPGNKKQLEKGGDDKLKDTTNIDKKVAANTGKTIFRNPLPKKKKYLEIEGEKLVIKENFPITGIRVSSKVNKTTKPVPFSFEKRNQEKQKKIDNEAKEQQSKISTPKKPSTSQSHKEARKCVEENAAGRKLARKSAI